MATMIRLKPRRSFDLKISSPGTVPENEQRRHSPHVNHDGHEAEPPERAVQAREAPEFWLKRPPEAPDAGNGGVPFDDREFRHGRSRS